MIKYSFNCLNKIILTILTVCFLTALIVVFSHDAKAFEQVSVGVTYYGGHYDEEKHYWVVDNTYQCDRIKSGEFSSESLGAVPSEDCDDDPGYGYFDYIPLHNTMSYAELSINPAQRDFSALGNLPARTRLQVEYAGKCVVLEKLDVGGGGTPVRGYQRSIDLWWETARSLGFTNGFDIVTVSYIDQSVPLTPLGQTSNCIVKPVVAVEPEGTGVEEEAESTPEDLEEQSTDTEEREGEDVKQEVLSDSDSTQDSVRADDYGIVVIVLSAVLLIAGIVAVILHIRRPGLSLKRKPTKE